MVLTPIFVGKGGIFVGLRREVLEAKEEREKNEAANAVEVSNSDNSDDRDFHGIFWNMLHDKFIGDD